MNKALIAIDGSGNGREFLFGDALGVIAAVEPALEDGVGTALFDGAICGGAREGLETDFAADHFPDGLHFREDFVAADFDLGVGEDGHGSRWMQLCIVPIHHNRDEAIDFPGLTTSGYNFVAHPILLVFGHFC